MTSLRPCLACGAPSPASWCPTCRPPENKPGATARGYDWTWEQLSKRARRLQPWCTDCSTTEDLTTDHSEEAWKRKAAGKVIRLSDVDVVCRSCNSKRGPARPRGDTPTRGPSGPDPKARSGLHTSGGYA